MSDQKNTLWTRISGNTSRDPILIGRKISPDWLKEKIRVIEFSFVGELFSAFEKLLTISKQESKKNLPIISLRMALIAGMDKIVSLDRDLGLISKDNGSRPCAISMYPWAEDDANYSETRKTIARYLQSWIMNDLEPWAERNGLGEMASKLKKQVTPEGIVGTEKDLGLMGEEGRSPNFALIARTIADRLIGEKLFYDMSDCELVASPESNSNTIELMTLPKSAKRGDDIFSMVARLSVCTMPYSNDLFLGVSASKRVWSKRVPIANSKMPKRVTGYVMSAGRPAIMVPVERSESGWRFSDAYASIQQESGFSLPNTLEEAIQSREYNDQVGWWVGLPELPTLFKFVSPRTVFEGDEATLLNTVTEILGSILVPRKITLREIPLSRKKKPLQEMLRLADLDFGAAGDSLVSEPETEEGGDSVEDEDSSPDRGKGIQHYREQNIRALKLKHGDAKPILWVLCNSAREREIIEHAVKTLFGDAVKVNSEPLPSGTHGLRADMDGSDLKSRQRFDLRVAKWEVATKQMKAISGDRPIIALICAADKYNQRNEDAVNYYAGIHAMSKIGANVHHVLPIEIPDDARAEQSFLHRAQSALLDVFLAHSGIIFGTKDFAAQLITPEAMPNCVYGLQAVRSKARSRSGESGVTFLLNTRLIIETGVTEVQFVYKTIRGTQRSSWRPLSEGLQWLGSQRLMHEGDETWLRNVFEEETKQTISEIAQADPRAIVMIDWQSLAGLWRGIRDSDTKPGSPLKLGNSDLSVFKDMTFVRLRRGADTLSLRTEVKISFEGWRESAEGAQARTGESMIDAYYTTEKELVEVSDETLLSDRPFGHFIASMGYAKTVQVKRGFSCYRQSARMHRIKGSNMFEQKMLDPASMDASLPASMEITVLTTPSGLSPANIAMLVMGLRIGYAHYNEWTALPAPLFFRRKIEDYVIRFPEEEESSSDVSEDGGASQGGEGEQTFISRLVESGSKADDGVFAAEDVESLPMIEKPVIESESKVDDEVAGTHVESEDGGSVEAEPVAANDRQALLNKAKATEMPALHTSKDQRIIQLARRMLHQDSNIRVRVSLPYWFKTKGAFGEYTPNIRRNAARCWRTLREFGVISTKSQMPRESEFLDWLANMLQIPHACHGIVPCCGHIGGLTFVRFNQLILEQYNAEKPIEEQISADTLSTESMQSMAAWANEKQNDEFMAWLVFQVAQFPSKGFCEGVLGAITKVPGPLTEESLRYYLDVASAMNDAIAQKDHLSKFQAVLRRRQRPIEETTAVVASAMAAESIGQKAATEVMPIVSNGVASPRVDMSISKAAKAIANVFPHRSPEVSMTASAYQHLPPLEEKKGGVQQENAMEKEQNPDQQSFAGVKTKLLQLADTLVPGCENFTEIVSGISACMDELTVLHRREQERNNQANMLRQRFDGLRSTCTLLIEKLEALKDELALGKIKYTDPAIDEIEKAEESVSEIQSIVGDIEALRNQANALDNMPVNISIDERRKRNKIISDAWDSISTCRDNLKVAIKQSHCLAEDTQPSDPDGVGLPEIGSETAVEATQKTSQEPVAAESAATMDQAAIEPVVEAAECQEVESSPEAIEELTSSQEESVPVIEEQVVTETEVPAPATQIAPEEKPVAEEVEAIKVVETSQPKIVVDVVEPPLAVDVSEIGMPVSAEFAEDEEIPETDPETIGHLADVLDKLIDKRMFGMAAVHVEAMRTTLEEFSGSESNQHYVVLRALVESLYRMDCQFEFDPKLDSALRELLATQSLAGDDICDQVSVALGVLAAGLSSMLFDRSDVQWSTGNAISQRLAGHKALTDLIEHIDTLRKRGLPLTRDMFASSHIGDQEALRQEIGRYQQRAANWKTDSEIYSSWHHRGFKVLHEDMLSNKHVIGACVDLIAKGETAKVAAAYEEARRKLEKPSSTVDELFKKNGEKSRPDGLYRTRAIENVEVTKRFIEEYLDMLHRKEKPNVELVKNIQGFLATLHRKLEEAKVEVNAIPVASSLARVYRDAALSALRCALRLFDNTQAQACIPQDEQKLLIQAPIGRDLMPVMNEIDELTPAICNHLSVLEETERWSKENLTFDGEGESIYGALKDAMRQHISAQRFLPAFLIDRKLRGAGLSVEPVNQKYNERKTSFEAELQIARQRVTHALTLSALTQNEANRMQRVIEEMMESIRHDRGIGHPDADKSSYPDFPQATAALRYNVLMPLQARLDQVAQLLKLELDVYAEESKGISNPQDIQRVRAMLDSDNAALLRTAHDALALLKTSNRLPARISGPIDIASAYDGFMGDVFRSIHSNKPPMEALQQALSEAPSEDDPEWLARMDEEQRKEGAKIIDAWLNLFKSPRRNMAETAQPLEEVFHRLGINQEPTIMPDMARQNRLRFMLPERSFTFMTSADDEVFIPPILGSVAKHIQGFLLYGSPQETDLRQLMHDIGGNPTVVLAHTRLNMQKRSRVSGGGIGAPVVLIDDDLVCYLAINPNERLQALLRVAMLTFGTNPYDDYGGRPVPPEMFFGRQNELARLRDVKSFGILYGGRRLGKSSLLSQVEIETDKIPNSKAVYISMDTVDASTDHVFSAWDFVYRNLMSRRIIGQMPQTAKSWQDLRDFISKELPANGEIKSLYLLIDEADTLMGCELRLAKGDVGFVRSLQQMVENLQHSIHIRYVIAGLHNMTRMTTEENSVLGKAETIALQPFSTPSDIQRGIRLITKPLAAMGYLFGEEAQDLPLRILSVCNFYPAFIQLYCKSLVERLQNRRQEIKPPLYIKSDDLDAVENDSNLLSELRRKFELNLDLDKRYKAIALILADAYYTEIERGHYSGLTISTITELCESLAPHHFANTGPGVYEALLDEMIKLNVVEREGTRYVLRNPNIAMMMGDQARVMHKIEELSREPSVESRNLGERRISIEYGHNHMLFPFPIAWVRRYLDPSDGELLIITGNESSGIIELMQPGPREEWKIGQGQDCYMMMPSSGPSAANEYLNQIRKLKKLPVGQRIMAVRPNSWTIPQIPEFANIAVKATKVGIRIVLLALPERAYELSVAINSGKLPVEKQNWRVVPIPQWTEDAVYFRMHENTGISENSAAIASIIEATCGYHREINHFCSGKMSLEEAMKLPELASRGYASSMEEFHKRIGLPAAFTKDRREKCNSFMETIDGEKRSSSSIEEVRELEAIEKSEMDFLYWMGLLQEGPLGTWRVPKMYRDLISGK